MSKFNTTNRTNKTPDSVNMSGGVAYSRDDFRKEVASVVLNSMLSGDSFYESEAERLKRIETLLDVNIDNSEFLMRAMVYNRNEANLRSVSHFMGTLLTEKVKGSEKMKPAILKSLVRPDDLTEMVSLWNSRNPGKNIPNSLRKAGKQALETKWDVYQFRKYAGNSNQVKLKDLVKIMRPSPKNFENRDVFKQVIEDTLPKIDTAQTVNAGSTGEDRASNYKSMLSERKLGYMAALKNIKNILESEADQETIDMWCSLIENKNAVLKSRVLPFRFTQAYSIVDAMGGIDRISAKRVLKAIEQGFILSAKNIPIVPEGGKVAILLDESGSMGGWSGNDMTNKNPFMVGKTLMASMLTGLDRDKTVGYLWADNAREISIDGSPMNFIKNTTTQGGGTNLGQAMNGLVSSKTNVDVVVVFTDMQQNSIGGRSWYNESSDSFPEMVKKYRKLVNQNTKFIFWNLEGYGGGSPMKLDHNILEVSGYSDKMLEIIPKMLKDKDALIKEIESIEL